MDTTPRAGSVFMAAYARTDKATRALLLGDLLFSGVAALTPEGERVDPLEPQRPGVLMACPTGWEVREIVPTPTPQVDALAAVPDGLPRVLVIDPDLSPDAATSRRFAAETRDRLRAGMAEAAKELGFTIETPPRRVVPPQRGEVAERPHPKRIIRRSHEVRKTPGTELADLDAADPAVAHAIREGAKVHAASFIAEVRKMEARRYTMSLDDPNDVAAYVALTCDACGRSGLQQNGNACGHCLPGRGMLDDIRVAWEAELELAGPGWAVLPSGTWVHRTGWKIEIVPHVQAIHSGIRLHWPMPCRTIDSRYPDAVALEWHSLSQAIDYVTEVENA